MMKQYWRELFRTLYVTLILIFLFSCQKNEIVQDSTTDSTIIFSSTVIYDTKYIITLSGNKLMKYEKYNIQNDIESIVEYEYDLNKITSYEYRNNEFNLYMKNIYIMENGYVISSYDSIYSDSNWTWVNFSNYVHTEDVLSDIESYIQQILNDSTYSFLIHSHYSYSNRNLVYLGSYCSKSFEYTDLTAKFDVNNFNSFFLRNGSENLRSLCTYRLGCPEEPSWVFPYIEYKYYIDSDGYVTKAREIDHFNNNLDTSYIQYSYNFIDN